MSIYKLNASRIWYVVLLDDYLLKFIKELNSKQNLVTMAAEEKNFKNISLIKRKPLSLIFWYVALSSGLLPILPILCPMDQNWSRPRGQQFYIEI